MAEPITGPGEVQGPKATLELIAYQALWELRDMDPEGEPAPFRVTRLKLHQLIHDGGDSTAPAPPQKPVVRHLQAVTADDDETP